MSDLENDMKLEARLLALEFTLGKLVSAIFSQQQRDVVADMLENWPKSARAQVFPMGDPAVSDAFGQEYEVALHRLLEGIKALSDEQRAKHQKSR